MDETGIDAYLYREYGRAKRGTRVFGKVRGRRFKRTGIVAAKRGESVIAPLQYEGTMDSALFEQCLLKELPEQTVIVLDNASFHRKSRLFRLAAEAGSSLVFLPPYSPELNPIEHFWGWLKGHLRTILPFHSSFDDALCSAFQAC